MQINGILFESRVVLDGSQTLVLIRFLLIMFESRVVLDGSQTLPLYFPFPNGV